MQANTPSSMRSIQLLVADFHPAFDHLIADLRVEDLGRLIDLSLHVAVHYQRTHPVECLLHDHVKLAPLRRDSIRAAFGCGLGRNGARLVNILSSMACAAHMPINEGDPDEAYVCDLMWGELNEAVMGALRRIIEPARGLPAVRHARMRHALWHMALTGHNGVVGLPVLPELLRRMKEAHQRWVQAHDGLVALLALPGGEDLKRFLSGITGALDIRPKLLMDDMLELRLNRMSPEALGLLERLPAIVASITHDDCEMAISARYELGGLAVQKRTQYDRLLAEASELCRCSYYIHTEQGEHYIVEELLHKARPLAITKTLVATIDAAKSPRPAVVHGKPVDRHARAV